MKKICLSLILSLCICAIPLTAFAAYSNTVTMTYYRNGYSYGWDYVLHNIQKEGIYTGSSVYGEINYSSKSSWTSPTAVLVNTYGTYRTNSVSLSSSGDETIRLYNMSAPQGEYINVLLMGSSMQTGADTIRISFTPH